MGAVAFSNKATISVTFLHKSSWVVFCLGSGRLEANSPRLQVREGVKLAKKGGFRGRSPLTCVTRVKNAPKNT